MKRMVLGAALCGIAMSSFAQNDGKMDKFITDLMSKMSIEEKIGQLNLASNWMYVSNATLSDEDLAIKQLKEGQMGAFYGFT
ncbi:MAG: beta-glucosidase, partial [Bacteroidaceae bacterium]|nr:beta-glucosidase [Bacteroidaceae bacterium]